MSDSYSAWCLCMLIFLKLDQIYFTHGGGGGGGGGVLHKMACVIKKLSITCRKDIVESKNIGALSITHARF